MNPRNLRRALNKIKVSQVKIKMSIEQIFNVYATNKLDHLIGQLRHNDKAIIDLQNFLLEVADFYKLRSDLSYNYSPDSYLNQACFVVATHLEPVLGINRYQLIMPALKVLSSVITATDLATEDLAFHRFVQTGDRFIEIMPCLKAAEADGKLKHTTLVDGQVAELNDEESKLVLDHSKYTMKYWKAVEHKLKIEKNGLSVGAALTRLANGLTEGSVGTLGDDVEFDSGASANNTIALFSEWLETLTGEEHDMLMACQTEDHQTTMQEIWGRLARPADEDYNEEIFCIDLLRDPVQSVLRENKYLFDMIPASLDQDKIRNLVRYDFEAAEAALKSSREKLEQAMQDDSQVAYSVSCNEGSNYKFIIKLFTNEDFQQFVPSELARDLLYSTRNYRAIKKILTDDHSNEIFDAWVSPWLSEYTPYEDCVLKMKVISRKPKYNQPWHAGDEARHSGSGVVIEHEGRKYILCTAHLIQNAIRIGVVKVGGIVGHDRFDARVKCVSYQSDLALLEIDDPVFQKKAKAAQMGEMLRLQQTVEMVGFNAGGDEISIGDVVVSDIAVNSYKVSHTDMLRVQLKDTEDFFSDGQIFLNGKIVGVAFEGLFQNRFMIPMPNIQHFLTEAFSGKPYRGYPVLPVIFESLVNPALRASYGMREDQSGMRVESTDILCDAHGKLLPDDILLEIDGLKVSNEGKVVIPGIGDSIYMLHVMHSKFIGDSVALKVLRKNPVNDQLDILDISVVLDCVPDESTKVPPVEHDKMPSYFVCSGISFVPLTRNYLLAAELDETMIDRETGINIFIAPKERPDDQYVMINEILDAAETIGYEHRSGVIVKEVNGRKISNIRDVIEAMENNRAQFHTIIMDDKHRVVVKNMSLEENARLLARYDIPADRSVDLRVTVPSLTVGMEVAAAPSLLPFTRASTARILQEIVSEDSLFASSEESDESSGNDEMEEGSEESSSMSSNDEVEERPAKRRRFH